MDLPLGLSFKELSGQDLLLSSSPLGLLGTSTLQFTLDYSPALHTSLTSHDDDYKDQVYLEATRNAFVLAHTLPSTLWTLPLALTNFLGKDFTITRAQANSITLSQPPQCP